MAARLLLTGTVEVGVDLTQTLVAAWKAVEAADLPEKVQGIAFEQAFHVLNTGTEGRRSSNQNAPSKETESAKNSETTPRTGEETVDEDAYFEKFAEEAQLDIESLRAIYLFKDGQVKLGLPRRRLGESEAEKNRTVALLLAGARWYAEGKASLPLAEVRTAAKAAGYEPSRNLGSHMDSVPGTQSVGVKNEKAIRVQGKRFDEPFRQLVTRMTEE